MPPQAAGHEVTDDLGHVAPFQDQTGKAISVAVDASGAIPVSLSGAASTVTANQGTPAVAANKWPVQHTDGINNLPAMDAPARRGYVTPTDGTNTAPTMDVAARAGFQKITDGINTLPTMDVAARAGFVQSAAASQVDGHSATIGATGDAEAAAGNGSVIAILKRLRTLLNGGLPAALSAAGFLKTALFAATDGGVTPFKLLSAASTNASSVKGSAGQVYGWDIQNTNAAIRYLKLYNKASAPVVGTDPPVITIGVPASGHITLAVPQGVSGFGLGIALATTTGAPDADTGAVGANDLILALLYA